MEIDSFRVDSYHVNIGNGDGSIHVLVSQPGRVAHKCVLIDGGSAMHWWKLKLDPRIQGSTHDPIRDMVKYLGSVYDWGADAPGCRFDTIVLTHWDEDHWGKMLRTIMEDAYEADKNKTRIPYLKYDADGLPETYFYVPNFYSRTDLNLNGARSERLQCDFIHGRREPYAFINAFYYISWLKKEDKWIPFAILRSPDVTGGLGLRGVLGAELFNNTLVPDTIPLTQIADITRLATANPPGELHSIQMPALYCICVHQMVLGPPAVEVIPEGVTMTNQVSIVCVLYWASTGRISHYLGGDADQDTESKVLGWLTRSGSRSVRITSVKLSHHGSRSSTPLDFWDTVRPKNVIISLPIRQHHHPSLEVLYHLFVWSRSRAPRSRPAVLGTKYPFFLVAQPTGLGSFEYPAAGDVKVDFLEDAATAKYAPYWEYCDDLIDEINTNLPPSGPRLVSLAHQYRQVKADHSVTDPTAMRPFVLDQLRSVWNDMCHPFRRSHPSVGQGYGWPERDAITEKNQIDVVVIISRNDDNDGIVYHKYRNVRPLFPYHRPSMQSLYPTQNEVTAANAAKRYLYFFKPNFATAPSPGPSVAAGRPADIQRFYLDSCVVVTGRYANPPGTDPNEDEPEPLYGPLEKTTPSCPSGAKPVHPRMPIQEDGGYYLYASIISPQSITVAATQYTILSTGPLNTLLSVLHCANLCLAGPSPPGPTGTTPVLDSDEFGHYLMTALQAEGLSIINAPGPSYVAGFSFAAAPISGSSADQAVLPFTTAAVEDAFGLQPGTGPPLGILEDARTLVFGLDTSVWGGERGTGAATATLAQLVQFADITYLMDSPAMAFLGTIELVIANPATGKRNAVWFEPLSSYRTTTRLQMDLSGDAVARLNAYISALPGLSIASAFAIARRTSVWSPAPPPEGAPPSPNASITYDGSLTFGGEFILCSTKFDAAVELLSTQIVLTLVLRDKVDILGSLFSTLRSALGLQGDHFEFLDWLKKTAGNTSFELPYLRRIVVVLDNDSQSTGSTSSTPGLASLLIDLETRVSFSSGAFAVFLITYTWSSTDGGTSSNTLTAALWTLPSGMPSVTQPELLPDYEEYYSLMPPVTLKPGEQLPQSLDLRRLGGFDNLPSEINPEVTRATLTVWSGGIVFGGDVVAGPPQGDIPRVSLARLSLDATYLFEGGFSGSLAVMAKIQAPPGTHNPPYTQIQGGVFYDGTTWKLAADADSITGSTLYQFFDPDVRGGIGQVLDNLQINNLTVEYNYMPNGGASSFAIGGQIAIGTLALSLSFACASTSSWEFTAALDTSKVPSTGTKLGDLLDQIFGPWVEDDLPDFILDIPIDPPRSKDAVGLNMVSVAGPEASIDRGLFFTAWLKFQYMSFQALQYQAPTPAGGSGRPPPRRVFTFVVNALPAVKIPLIGDLTQPFDQMLLMYVQPRAGDNDAGAGITYRDLQIINAQLASAGRPQLPYQVTKKRYQDTDVVLPIGGHFILMLKDSTGQPHVVLDYVFYTPPVPVTETLPRPQLIVRKDETSGLVNVRRPRRRDDEVQDPGEAKAPYSKKIGPLTISNMGFKYSGGTEPTLSIIMDASIVLGPIEMALLGFSLDLKFTKGVTLYQLPTPGMSLTGLGVAFNEPPVVFGGLLQHVIVDDKPAALSTHRDYYQGGVALSFDPYLFEAEGFYGTVTSDVGSFRSVFAYFVLGGPLVDLEYVQITDVTGGFGYNSNVQFPTATNVLQFPFLEPISNPDASTVLSTLVNTGWFFPQEGSFWLAAGLGVTAFEVLQSSVVAVVQWDPDVYLGLFGVATADMPPEIDEAKLMHVEMGVVATVDFKNGVLKIDGQLAPSSWVLDPACHLTGGYALYWWFGGTGEATTLAPNDGDFVYTIGGFHRGFHRPAQYPNPKRLAINWSVDSSLSIKGEAYFAITPNICMAGGCLDASLSLGPLSAWFNAYADVLINYKPFFFSADGGISVGVGFVLDLWICTIDISCEIAATLHLQGPPLSGTVYVDFWVFGFYINFGQPSEGNDQPLSLTDFYNLALQADLQQQAAFSPSLLLAGGQKGGVSSAAGPPPPHIYMCNEGLIPTGTAISTPNSPDTPWNVRGAVFQFTIGCKFAIDTATVVTAQSDPNDPAIPPFEVPLTGSPIYARPMQLTSALSSTLTVTITPPEGTSPNQPRWDACTGVIKTVPKALWGPYSPANDPLNPANPNRDPNRDPVLLNPSPNANPDPFNPAATLSALTTGLTLSSPPPTLSTDFLPAFDYETYFTRDAGAGETFHFPDSTEQDADGAWYPRPLAPGHEPEEWEDVRSQWAGTPGLGERAGELAVGVWSALSFAGWVIEGGEEGGGGGEERGMTGRAPTGGLLVKGRFEEEYLEAPRLAAVAG